MLLYDLCITKEFIREKKRTFEEIIIKTEMSNPRDIAKTIMKLT